MPFKCGLLHADPALGLWRDLLQSHQDMLAWLLAGQMMITVSGNPTQTLRNILTGL